MNDNRPKRESMSLEEATISNMWEIAALVEVLERKGLCTKQDLYDIIGELRNKNPKARIPETIFPSPYLMTQTEEKSHRRHARGSEQEWSRLKAVLSAVGASGTDYRNGVETDKQDNALRRTIITNVIL